jgi:DNA polymerase-4
MPISVAYRLCPKAVFLPVDIRKYDAVSRRIYAIFYEFTPDIEPVSIDEAFLDISGSWQLFGTPIDACRRIKSRIRETTGLAASVGLAPTKMAAKIASETGKPDGLICVEEKDLTGFLAPLDISKLWGLGEKTRKILNDAGIFTIGELAAYPVEGLEALLGSHGAGLQELAKGIDGRAVVTCREAKSISNEVTFDRDTSDNDRIRSAIMELCEKVSLRLRQDALKARTVTVKIRLEGFQTHTRSRTLERGTNFVETIYGAAKELYECFDSDGKRIRLIGVKMSGLAPSGMSDELFRDISNIRREELHRAVDRITEKFGHGAVFRATSAARPSPHGRGI